MALHIASINSGSNGNCYYVGNARHAVLIDAGISCRETVKRMQRLGLSMEKVRAIFISHEHTDHIAGMAVLSKRFQLPVYLPEGMVPGTGRLIQPEYLRVYQPDEEILIQDLAVQAFRKFHDAVDPHSFVVSHAGIRVGVFTDLGRVCDGLMKHFRDCHAAFLEANYDREMLQNGPYPYYLKKRITGGHGHLSNDEALDLFVKHKPAHMSHVLLSHLSRENNDPNQVLALFRKHAGPVTVSVASRHEESPVFYIGASESVVSKAGQSLSLFDTLF